MHAADGQRVLRDANGIQLRRSIHIGCPRAADDAHRVSHRVFDRESRIIDNRRGGTKLPPSGQPKVPCSISTTPEKVLLPVKVNLFGAIFVSVPLEPLTSKGNAISSERSMIKLAVGTAIWTFPYTPPVVPPVPSWRMPLETVVSPVRVFVLARMAVPGPVLFSPMPARRARH